MNRRHIAATVAIIAVAAAGAVAVRIASNPLRKSDAELQTWLLAKTPLGSASNQVWFVFDQHDWKLRYTTSNSFVGEFGGYQGFPFYNYVGAIWEFDSSNRLAGIRIWRIRDAW